MLVVNFLTVKSENSFTKTAKLQCSEEFPALINSTLGTFNELFATLWTSRDFTTFSYVFIARLFFSSSLVKFTSHSYCFPIISLNLILFRFHSFSSCALTFSHIELLAFQRLQHEAHVHFKLACFYVSAGRRKKNHIIRGKSASEEKEEELFGKCFHLFTLPRGARFLLCHFDDDAMGEAQAKTFLGRFS